MLLHVVHNDAAVSRKATSVALVVDVRIAVMLPCHRYTVAKISDELVQIEEEELLHDDSLRKEYGEVCVSDEESSDSGSSLSEAEG